jgi:hypothetical protein
MPGHFPHEMAAVKSQLAWSEAPAKRRPGYNAAGDRAPAGAEENAMAAGEAPIKQAVKWLEEQLSERPDADRVRLVDEASRRFDLSPLDTDFLVRHLAQRRRP